MTAIGTDSLNTRSTLSVKDQTYDYYSIQAADLGDLSRLPFSLKVLLENLLRFEDSGQTVSVEDIRVLANAIQSPGTHEIQFRPSRVLMQDFTGVPAIVDLAAMRDAISKGGDSPTSINPLVPVDLVIDHSVIVDHYASNTAFSSNVDAEMDRNHERYEFLRWGQKAFDNFRVVPPGTGICHQVNLEYLAKTVWVSDNNGYRIAYPDTLVGTDSHTTMINSLGVLGWGVGGIEAEAAMLGQPISMLIPEVIGCKVVGRLREGITATDLVLTVADILRKKGVVGKFVEFYGEGLSELALPDRATIANMAPEYGATCVFFPVDRETLKYMKLTGRSDETIALVEAYCKIQGLWRDNDTLDPEFSSALTLDLSTIVPGLAGPKRPNDHVPLNELDSAIDSLLTQQGKIQEATEQFPVNAHYSLCHGDTVITAITSCTNTSNPSVMMAAGLLAKNAVDKGLMRKPWVKSSLAPGSKVVTDYLKEAGLQTYLDLLGFNLVGYGCTTCIGNSGPLLPEIEKTIIDNDLTVSAVLSGNRNFEGRIHPLVKANWLASPPLVVAFALAGTTRINLDTDPLGTDNEGHAVYLKDIWPSNRDIAKAVTGVSHHMFTKEYTDVFTGEKSWRAIPVTGSETYQWNAGSTYIQNPPFFDAIDKPAPAIEDIKGARILALFGDSITTDHISPAGAIKADSPAGLYLKSHGVKEKEFNSYGSRRGNHEVMMRGTFANIRIRNEMVKGVEGGYTRDADGQQMPIYDAAMHYQAQHIPLVVIAGKEYGTGSSRDWAAKGTLLLGVKAVITEGFERIHRSNLVGMGVLPLQFKSGQNRTTLALDGSERVDIHGMANLNPGETITATIHRQNGSCETIELLCRIDTENELAYFRAGGILHYVLRNRLGTN